MDIHDRLAAESRRRHSPEAVGVIVVGAISERIARLVAPVLARVLFPDRHFGDVVNCEPASDAPAGSFHCDVLVIGTPLSAATIGR